MLTKAVFYRLHVPFGFTLAERQEELSTLAACCMPYYLQGEAEERLFHLHAHMQLLDQQTYQALFALYASVGERIIKEMQTIALTYPQMESEAAFGLFQKGFTAFVLDSKKLLLSRLSQLCAMVKEDLREETGWCCQKKSATLASKQGLVVLPIDFKEAKAFVAAHHRHNKPPVGGKFSLACLLGTKVVGVAICGRPVSRVLDNGTTLEVTRLCTDGTVNACSKLYAACWKVASAMGYHKLITYILSGQSGTSLKAAGWNKEAVTDGGSWNCPARKRKDTASTSPKVRYSIC